MVPRLQRPGPLDRILGLVDLDAEFPWSPCKDRSIDATIDKIENLDVFLPSSLLVIKQISG